MKQFAALILILAMLLTGAALAQSASYTETTTTLDTGSVTVYDFGANYLEMTAGMLYP